MKHLTLTLALALPLACDPAETEPVGPRGLDEVLYLSQLDADVDLAEFTKIVLSCDGVEKPKLAVTWSVYDPPPAGGPQVMGLGFSTYAGPALVDCYRQHMLDLGAHP